MTQAYANDLRARAMARVAAGETIRTVAGAPADQPVLRLESCVSKWSGRWRATGRGLPGQVGGHKPRVRAGAPADWLRHLMSSAPFTAREDWRRN